jgi:hypothetical protein
MLPPQHCEEAEHEPPALTQPPAPRQTPPVHVNVPQQSALRAQRVPALWHEPELQTLFALQSKVPQQSPLEPHVWLLLWQAPTCGPPGMEFGSTPPVQAASARTPNTNARPTRERGIMAMIRV